MEVVKCVYCGDDANCVDHVIPISFTGERRKYDGTQWIVDCCRTCNELASNRVFFSIPEKAEFIHNRLQKRFSKVLKVPFWKQAELEETDYIMREYVFNSLVAKRVVLEKQKGLKRTMQLHRDCLMPSFIKARMVEWMENYKKLLEKTKKNEKLHSRSRLLQKTQCVKAECVSMDKGRKN